MSETPQQETPLFIQIVAHKGNSHEIMSLFSTTAHNKVINFDSTLYLPVFLFSLLHCLSHNVKSATPNDRDNRLHLHDTFH